ncbi:ABC transporter substrate-binding protein [Acetanaerobacterium elongatum]|uniref:Putative ABC transport system substrate-binding protein n=1 Tax=Acetanaerobacterium elongatum TaxID=258515 RepID=A0A1G9U6W9_9FIRM|nr:ABC transporter substrate-binding protein [Acetanaerobacterium elongatum]SDM55573.1 putative ABC transport system substrate-binding protein [Acetanaerobacterium elongatum]
MKKFLSVAFALALTVSLFAGCASSNSNKVVKIGVIQLLEHPALDDAYKGFVDGLKEAGYEDGKNIKIDYQNAQNEQANCQTIATKFVNDKEDLILAIATPAAQAVANATKDIPILVTAVTDPASAKLVQSNEKPGTNVSGTSDLNPIKEQIALLKQVVPNAKTVALMYCSNEANSKFQIDLAKAECEKLGIQTFEATISNSNELQQVTQSVVGKCDAVYIPTDNTIAGAMATVGMVAEPAKLPVIVGEANMVKNGGIATYGINYYNLGKQTAAMAVKIMKDGAKPADMPIEYLTNLDLTLNTELAAKIGVTFPQELLDKAKK